MLYPVRIIDPKGNVEKVIKEKELSKRYWKEFNEALPSTGKGGGKRKTRIRRS